MKRILVIANNLKQASYRLRVEALVPLLADRGFALDVRVRPRGFFSRRRLLRSAGEYDAVLLQRKLLDPCDARLLGRCARRVLYDIDDAVMYHAHAVGWWSRFRTRRRFLATAAILDHVVPGNEYLANIFREQGCEASVLPTVVDPGHYQVKTHGETNSPCLVWIGSRSTLPYLREYLPAIKEAARKVPGLRLITIGDDCLQEAGLPVDHVVWSVENEAASLARGDIGIAPTPTDRWTLGKCGFKIIQYMAAGLPVVASPVGANAEIVRNNETGFLPPMMVDWSEAIVRLARDARLRAEFGGKARELVEREYSLVRGADHWAGLLGK